MAWGQRVSKVSSLGCQDPSQSVSGWGAASQSVLSSPILVPRGGQGHAMCVLLVEVPVGDLKSSSSRPHISITAIVSRHLMVVGPTGEEKDTKRIRRRRIQFKA
ncbi:hypothetical protein QBC32DRAFT_353719 [Pseudoneurospora amorphoporcata]|uniref:Uncharacterized protein n=1 Tax=Pseudoneurospora amorphoporcata TaxID=241081 RepID=A0AAN6NP52_9PEZI|nr:hypothetical protein QBC32DRAFT_353719 [Pseudoneurospora amorphoporcata]